MEQSYCTDWRVYQVVSHIGPGSRIGRMRLESWVNGTPAATHEVMQGVWGLFDSLPPEQMPGCKARHASPGREKDLIPGPLTACQLSGQSSPTCRSG